MRSLRRLLSLPARDLALLAESAALLAVAAAAIRLLPFQRLVRRIEAAPRSFLAGRSQPDRIAWAVAAVARRMPFRALCFQQGLAGYWMLRRRGMPAMLHYGLGARDAGLAGHVWLSLDGRVLLGGETAPHFQHIVSFPRA
jgi:hypothetical protein